MATRVKLAELIVELVAKTDKFTKSMEGVKKDTKGLTDVLGGVAKGAGKGMAGAFKIAAGAAVGLAGGIVAAGGALTKLALNAAPLQGIGQSFDNLSQKFGVSLDAMKEAAGGTVSDFDLMRKANVALTGAGEDFGREFGKNIPNLLRAARAAAKATGQDVDFLFESLVTGIKRGSPLLIDNTGLVLKATEANEAMAKSLGKSVKELTSEEKQIALLNATVEAGNNLVNDMGGLNVTAAEGIAQAKAQFKNFTDQLGVAFLPVIEALLPPLMDLGQRVMPIIASIVEKVSGFLSTFLSLLAQGGNPLAALKVALFSTFGEAAFAIDPLINAIGQVVGWLQTNLPIAIQAASNFWQTTLQPAIQKFVTWIQTVFWPIAQEVLDWLQTNLPIAIEALSNVWETILLPAIETVWDFVQTSLIPLFESIRDFMEVALPIAIDVLKAAWEKTLKPALDTVIPPLESLANFILPTIEGALDGVAGAVEKVTGWFDKLTDKAKNFKMPSILTPGSPTPFELGLRGINSALQEMNNIELPELQANLRAIDNQGSPANNITNNEFKMTVNTQATTPTVVQDFRTLMGVVSA